MVNNAIAMCSKCENGVDVKFMILDQIEETEKRIAEELKKRLIERINTNTDIRDITEGTLFDWEVNEIVDEVTNQIEDKSSKVHIKDDGQEKVKNE